MLIIIIAGIATAFNYLILMYKLKTEQYTNFLFDLISFIFLNLLFVGSVTGMSIAMIASMFISLFTLKIKKKKYKPKEHNEILSEIEKEIMKTVKEIKEEYKGII